MHSWLRAGILAVVAVTAGAAEPDFSQAVRPDDFSAAGLSKLSPEELRRLNALVRDYKSGALEKARQEADAARERAARAEASARAAEAAAAAARTQVAEQPEKKASPGLIERAKVLLKPGTKVEYTTLESRLATDFTGWHRGTVFTLENGQRWRVVGGNDYVTPPMPAPKVRIEPGVLGTFWMVIEGVRSKPKVESLDAAP